jgi:hypothetical protein
MAANTVIASADNIVPVGVLVPDHVVTPAPVVDLTAPARSRRAAQLRADSSRRPGRLRCLPRSTGLPMPVCVKMPPSPCPPARMRSISVPCGTSSTSNSPAIICRWVSGLRPMWLTTTLRSSLASTKNRCLREIARYESAEQSYMNEGIQILELARNAQKLFERQQPREKELGTLSGDSVNISEVESRLALSEL